MSSISATDYSRLRWRCRRGLLENDLLIERYLARRPDAIDERDARGLMALMELAEHDLLNLLLRRTEPEAPLAGNADAMRVLTELRSPAGAA